LRYFTDGEGFDVSLYDGIAFAGEDTTDGIL
jgi:hypothetical protein